MATDSPFDVPERFNFGRDVVDRFAADRGRVALHWEDERGVATRYTFWDFQVWSNRIASLLAAHGVARGDAILVMLPRLPQWHAAIVAGLKLGALVIPCTAALRPKDVEYRATHSGARAIVTTREGAAVVEQVRARCPALAVRIAFAGAPLGLAAAVATDAPPLPEGWLDGDRELSRQAQAFEPADTAAGEPALCFYTSGTTKEPKAVLHGHAYTYCQRYTARFWLDAREDGLHWTTSDTGWAKAAYGVLFGPWGLGAPTLMYNGRFDPVRELELLERYQVRIDCRQSMASSERDNQITLSDALPAGRHDQASIGSRTNAVTRVRSPPGHVSRSARAQSPKPGPRSASQPTARFRCADYREVRQPVSRGARSAGATPATCRSFRIRIARKPVTLPPGRARLST